MLPVLICNLTRLGRLSVKKHSQRFHVFVGDVVPVVTSLLIVMCDAQLLVIRNEYFKQVGVLRVRTAFTFEANENSFFTELKKT